MAQAYSSFKKNGSAPTLSPADAFSEYSRSQETYIKSKEFAETITYWLGRFEPLPPQLDLPLPKLRPAKPDLRLFARRLRHRGGPGFRPQTNRSSGGMQLFRNHAGGL